MDARQNISGHLTALPAGYMLEGYRIERLLGEGGFGITYLGRDVESGKRVAIKELLPKEFATRTHGSQVAPHATHAAEAFSWALDSFMNEARTLAELAHPNIVQIHRLFRANGTAYMVMDYVDGQSMREWLKVNPRPTEAQLRGMLMPLLDGLEHVHEVGLLHRDIKPDNIYITAKGRPVLLDFGSARVDVGRTQTMTSLVSEGYSPLEQYQKKARQSAATDLYALAATLVRAITGENPTTAIDRSVDASLQTAVSVSHATRYSPAFLRAVDAAFAVRAVERPQSVMEWRAMLEGRTELAASERSLVDGSGDHVRMVREHEAGSRPPAGKPRNARAIIALVVVVAGVGAGMYLTGRHDGDQAQGGAEKGETQAPVPTDSPAPSFLSSPDERMQPEFPPVRSPQQGPATVVPKTELPVVGRPPSLPTGTLPTVPATPGGQPDGDAPVALTPLERRIAAYPALAKVVAVESESGLIGISAWKDKGLDPGMKLAIRRGSKLVARVTLLEVESREAIADMPSEWIVPGEKVEVGDEVIQDVPPEG